jgi:3-oxoacyl-[acyl-carrier protein] reductase
MEASHHAVITGGTGALGSAIANSLRQPGWRIDAPGSRELDVRNAQAIERYFHRRAVDLLVCAAGLTNDAPLRLLKPAAWDETFEVNFTGAARCARAVIPDMTVRGGGHIIFISSHSALHPPPGQAAYAAAKASLIGLVTDLSSRHGSANVRVNAVLPGFLETRMTETVTPRRRAEVLADHALRRFNTCEQVASFIRFLHHQLPHTSGQVFQLDSRPHFL